MSCGLAKYGRRELTAVTVVFLAACAGIVAAAAAVSWWIAAAGAVPAAAWASVLWFFRDPERRAPAAEGLLVSPADGRVADITPVGPDSELRCEGVKIGVFMNVLNVHVNRSPAAGRIEAVVRRNGAFLDARDPMAAERNASVTIRMTHDRGGRSWPIVVRQIAGLLARRIVTDLSVGQAVARGQRVGMIKFGSRVELLVPRELAGNVTVRVGQAVRAGTTVVIELGAGDES